MKDLYNIVIVPGGTGSLSTALYLFCSHALLADVGCKCVSGLNLLLLHEVL